MKGATVVPVGSCNCTMCIPVRVGTQRQPSSLYTASQQQCFSCSFKIVFYKCIHLVVLLRLQVRLVESMTLFHKDLFWYIYMKMLGHVFEISPLWMEPISKKIQFSPQKMLLPSRQNIK